MINRENYQAVKKYLEFRQNIDQVSPKTARLDETWLRHVLEWAGERSFSQAPKIKPAFPQYMLEADRRDDSNEMLSPAYISKVVRAARRLFRWLRRHLPGYNALTDKYLDTLVPPRLPDNSTDREIVTIEEITAIAQAKTESLVEERTRATAVFLFLSGIRVRAFVTLPLNAVDVETRTVRQWLSLGVETKNGKQATTYLLDIPELLDVVREWDKFLRSNLPETGLWYSILKPVSGKLEYSGVAPGRNRGVLLRRNLREWLNKIGLPYHSPHKFRHGHAVYALTQALDVSDLKAVSMNLMHSNLSVTDGVYGILSTAQVEDRIANLGKRQTESDADLASLVKEILRKMDEK